MTHSNKVVSQRFTDLFNTGDEAASEEILATTVIFHGGSAGEFESREALVGMIQDFRAGFPDVHSNVEDQIAEGDRVVTRWSATGTSPEGKRFRLAGITIERFEEGKIAEIWMNRDDLAMLQQLGSS